MEAQQVKSHRGAVYALVIFASLLAFISVFAIWANRQLLETDTWVDTSTELLEDDNIRHAVADFTVETIFTNVDVQAKLEEALPPRADPIAGIAAGGARQLANDLANKALRQPRVQGLWASANRTAHEKLVDVVENDTGDQVTLDLSTIVTSVGDQLGIDVASRLPEGAGQIVIVKPDQIKSARTAAKLLKTLAVVLILLALVLYGLAIYLAKGRRRETLRTVGFSFIVVGIAALAVRGIAGGALTDSLAQTASVEPAVQDTWSIGTSLLAAGATAAIFYGIVIVLGAWLAGPKGLARDARRGLTPILQERAVAYATLAVILLVLFWWAPTPGFQRLLPSLLLVALMVVGLEVLRRQAVREFPDQRWEGTPERWAEAARSRLGRDKD